MTASDDRFVLILLCWELVEAGLRLRCEIGRTPAGLQLRCTDQANRAVRVTPIATFADGLMLAAAWKTAHAPRGRRGGSYPGQPDPAGAPSPRQQTILERRAKRWHGGDLRRCRD
jgi:hypothetical protein